jgi:glycosyltransferase involved in cell wall biosynthesis
MRIWFINRFFYPDLSATAQILTELAEDLDAQRAHVTVVTGWVAYLGGAVSLPEKDTYKGVEILRVRSTKFGRQSLLGRLLDYASFYVSAIVVSLRARREDCFVVLTDPPLLSVLAAVVRMVKRCKTVCWMQDVFPDIAVQAGVFREGIIARVLRRLGKWSLRRMNRVVVLGRCMERHVLELGVPPERLVRIPNWADGALIRPLDRADNPFLDEVKLRDRFVVMYSGNLGMVHESDTIIGMIRGTRSLERLRFCLVGDGYVKQRLADLARRVQWKHVILLPYQAKERLRYSLAAGDVHLVTLKANMAGLSVPSKIYGIMAAGRPVIFIGPPDSEVAHLVREAACGFVIGPGDVQGAVQALLFYYRDPAQVEEHGYAARAYFERHCDRPIATQRFWQVLQQI